MPTTPVAPSLDRQSPVYFKLLACLGECMLKLAGYTQTPHDPDAVYDLSDTKNMLVHWGSGEPRLGVSSVATPLRLRAAHWQRRPPAARGMPPGFESIVVDEAVWLHVQTRLSHATADLIGMVFHFHRMPDLPLGSLDERQVALICSLACAPHSWDDLNKSLPTDERQLAADLHALLACQAIGKRTQESRTSEKAALVWRKGLAWLSDSAQVWGKPTH
jgi:hypothetical protein